MGTTVCHQLQLLCTYITCRDHKSPCKNNKAYHHCMWPILQSHYVGPTLPTTVETTATLHATVNTVTTGSIVNTGAGNAGTHDDNDTSTTTTSIQSVTTVADAEPNITGLSWHVHGWTCMCTHSYTHHHTHMHTHAHTYTHTRTHTKGLSSRVILNLALKHSSSHRQTQTNTHMPSKWPYTRLNVHALWIANCVYVAL